MSIKDIISKAREGNQDNTATSNQDTKVSSKQDSKDINKQNASQPSNQESKDTSNKDSKIPSNQDTKVSSQQSKKNKSSKDLARKVMNLDVPAAVKNYWMGQIKGEGSSFKKIVIDTLIKKYGLPENWTKDDL